MKFWPGTKIVKSTDNDFNWKAHASTVAAGKEFKASVAGTRNTLMQKSRQFTVYSKA